jgi:hypothetical protein
MYFHYILLGSYSRRDLHQNRDTKSSVFLPLVPCSIRPRFVLLFSDTMSKYTSTEQVIRSTSADRIEWFEIIKIGAIQAEICIYVNPDIGKRTVHLF